MDAKIGSPEPLLGLECLNCALAQVTSAAEMTNMPRARRLELMREAMELLLSRGLGRNNCEQIADVLQLMSRALGDDDPYRELRAHYNRGMLRVCPQVRRQIDESDDPLAAAVRAAIAGNMIDLAALGLNVSLDAALSKLREVERAGLYVDHLPSLRAALARAETLMVLGDNCGEVAMDRLLIETIRRLYPRVRVQYGVRGGPSMNDALRADAEMVGMGEVAEIIDNGDNLLTTMLSRTSEAFNRAFFAADVVIAKGMGNYEGLHACARGKIWFLMIVKCDVISRMTKAPKGSILCMEKGD